MYRTETLLLLEFGLNTKQVAAAASSLSQHPLTNCVSKRTEDDDCVTEKEKRRGIWPISSTFICNSLAGD